MAKGKPAVTANELYATIIKTLKRAYKAGKDPHEACSNLLFKAEKEWNVPFEPLLRIENRASEQYELWLKANNLPDYNLAYNPTPETLVNWKSLIKGLLTKAKFA